MSGDRVISQARLAAVPSIVAELLGLAAAPAALGVDRAYWANAAWALNGTRP